MLEHRSHLYRLMLRWGADREVAEDLLSSVVERYVHRREAGPVEKVPAYLRAMAKNAFLDHERGRHRETLIGEPQLLEHLMPHERPAEDVVTDGFADQELNLKISGLSPKVREVIKLLAMGYGTSQVAHRLGISRNTVHTYRMRAAEQYQKARIRSLRATSDRRGT
ncbi:RNA polymerase sigma factor [Streptomyces hydrogenans]|uniref:RNA polymerase sigma factor n=1 Tax=Streptomyces hydrogenans TaxID=1873719 RepID=UPI0035D821E2